MESEKKQGRNNYISDIFHSESFPVEGSAARK